MPFKVFLSAVSGELKSYRQEVARVLRRKGIPHHVQEDFIQGPATLLEKLRDYIAQCDAVIALIGDRCGAFPTDEQAVALGAVPVYDRYRAATGQLRASYTQWEYLLALHFKKKLYRFLTADGFSPDKPSTENADQQKCQQAFRQWLEQTGMDRDRLVTCENLIEDILVLPFPDLARPRPRKLPYPTLGRLFIGREKPLQDLRQWFEKARAEERWPNHAIQGLGGIGKTRTAVEYAWRYQDDYTALLFVNGESEQTLHRDLAGLSGVLDLNLQEGATDPERIRAVLGWLQAHPGWLLIVDNVDDRAARDAVAALLAQWHDGHVLITGRFGQWGKDVEPLDLLVLHEKDAARFLLESTAGARAQTNSDADDALALANDLGCLCLALEQASAYLRDRGISLSEYRRRWNANAKNVRAGADRMVMNYHMEKEVSLSVATTWQTTFDQLSAPARGLLQMLAWLAPDPLPKGLFQTEQAAKSLETVCGVRGADPEEALAELRRYSIMQKAQDACLESPGEVHRLVQLLTRERGTPEGQQTSLKATLDMVNTDAVGDVTDVRTWPLWDSLASHVQALVQHADATGIVTPTTGLMNQLGRLYHVKARYAEAEALYRRAWVIDKETFGTNHPNVATDLKNLAFLLKDVNRSKQAEPLFRQALDINVVCFGPGHPEVATALNNLGLLLKDVNRLGEAEPLFRQALDINEAAFGPDHPSVAVTLANLALLLKDMNCPAQAEPLFRRALQVVVACFGPDHAEVATALNNLAFLLKDTNRPGEAESLFRRALAINEAFFGRSHPEVATALNNLAFVLKDANRPADAEPLFRRALQIDEAVFGPGHPRVANRLGNLTILLQTMNRLVEAEPLSRKHLTSLVALTRSSSQQHSQLYAAIGEYRTLLSKLGLSEQDIYQRLIEAGVDPTWLPDEA